MKKLDGGFALLNPDNGKYVRFDEAVIVFETIEEVADFKNRYHLFFARTQPLPQIIAVDEAFIENGETIAYCNIDKKLLDEAEKEVKEMYRSGDN